MTEFRVGDFVKLDIKGLKFFIGKIICINSNRYRLLSIKPQSDFVDTLSWRKEELKHLSTKDKIKFL